MAVVAYVHSENTRLDFIASTIDFELIIGIGKIGRVTEVSESKK